MMVWICCGLITIGLEAAAGRWDKEHPVTIFAYIAIAIIVGPVLLGACLYELFGRKREQPVDTANKSSQIPMDTSSKP